MPVFAAVGIIWDLFWQEKWIKIGGGGRLVPGIGGHFDALGVIEEIKSPCGCRGFER